MNNNNKKVKAKIDPVEVYCRVRPIFDIENEKCLRVFDENNLMLQVPECSSSYRSGQAKQLIYSFTKILDETADQKRVFDELGLPLVQDVLSGKNGLLFTYGVTGSGKTYSMMGNPQDPGLLQRCLDTIFNSISFRQTRRCVFKPDKMNSFEIQNEGDAVFERKKDITSKLGSSQSIASQRTRAQADTEKLIESSGKLVEIFENHMYAVFISCVEIYNNYIYDLLDEADPMKRNENKESKSLKEDSKGFMYIKDMAEIEVKSTEEAIELMHRAQKRRVVAYTDLNAESSRSHSIFTIRIVQAPFDPSSNDFNPKSKAPIYVSQLSLVDLAGSERTKRTKNTGSRLKEAGNINSSLMALRNCIETLRENIINNTKKMVPYRDSKLTLLFKNYFEGNGKIKMILCLNPSAQEFDETINVLKFSELVKDVLLTTGNDNRIPKNIQHDFELVNSILNNLQQNNNSFSSNCPPLDVTSPDDDVTIKVLVEFLEDYNRRRNALIQEAHAMNQQLYCKLRELYDENDRIKEENTQLKFQLEVKAKKEIILENKLKALEKLFNTRTPVQKENMRPFPLPTPTTTAQDNDAVERKRNRDIETPSIQNTPVFSNRTNRIANTIGRLNNNLHNLPPPTPVNLKITSTQATTATTVNTQIQAHHYNRYQSPAVRQAAQPITFKEGVPVANKRAQRRSRSAENWLDHKPQNSIKTDTVLQPKMNRKKSVSKIDLADAKKSSKYVLTHQQQDDDGELVTSLIKGDVLQSPSGGANIIFTDVETLRVKPQDLPKPAPKRPSGDMIIEDRSVIEERCSIAIEGHSSFRKTIKKAKI